MRAVQREKLLAKARDKLRRDLIRGERIANANVASTLNPRWRILSILPILALLGLARSSAFAVILALVYLVGLFALTHSRARLIVYTDRRVMIYRVTGMFGANYQLLREVMGRPAPVRSFGGWWKRADGLGEPMWIGKT